MKKLLMIFCGAWISITAAGAQVVKKTVVEHFTNTKCSICATRNPGFHTNLDQHPQVNHISIHPSSPYSSCYLSLQNTVANNARTNYYGIYGGTPRIVINGTVISSGTNYSDTSIFQPFAGLTPISISIEQQAVGADSIRSILVLKRESNTAPFGQASLFAGLAEDTVFGNGGNGEQEHYNVLRKSLFSPSGLSISLPAMVGDSVVISKTVAYENFWNSQRMRTVAILQDSSSHALIQSELSTVYTMGAVTGIDTWVETSVNFAVFPNPVNHTLFIENLTNDNPTSFYLINSLGKKVLQPIIGKNVQLDVSQFANGIYFLINIHSNFVRKIIIQHS